MKTPSSTEKLTEAQRQELEAERADERAQEEEARLALEAKRRTAGLHPSGRPLSDFESPSAPAVPEEDPSAEGSSVAGATSGGGGGNSESEPTDTPTEPAAPDAPDADQPQEE